MRQSDSPILSSIDITNLENQVEVIVRAYMQLRNENHTLRQQQKNLLAEKAALIEKTELARTRVEAMVTKLKAMEHGL